MNLLESFSNKKEVFAEYFTLENLTTIIALLLISIAFFGGASLVPYLSSALTQMKDEITLLKSDPKTIFLIRHAESEENRRLACLSRSMKGIALLKLPSKSDMKSSVQLLNISAQIDSEVSHVGQEQIHQVGEKIKQDNFVEKMGIELVVHSPLLRARQTSEGMLECVAPSDGTINAYDSNHSEQISKGSRHKSVSRVVELEILKEKTPLEWLPINKETFRKRIEEFEKWLAEQPENVIAVVGHSQYFKSMLGLPKKFKNCDVWSLQFDYNGHLDGVVTDSSVQQDATVDTTTIKYSPQNDEEIYEVDGVRLDNLDLPKRWRTLKRHYTFST
jgi:broad specificity phosphatase PhoE